MVSGTFLQTPVNNPFVNLISTSQQVADTEDQITSPTALTAVSTYSQVTEKVQYSARLQVTKKMKKNMLGFFFFVGLKPK